jgi:L-lactate utilization protein LutC
MLQQNGVVMVEMKVLMRMMVMILMKSSAMMMMATISPLREGISLADFSLSESFSLLVFSAPQRRRCLSLMPPSLRFLGMTIYVRGRWQ